MHLQDISIARDDIVHLHRISRLPDDIRLNKQLTISETDSMFEAKTHSQWFEKSHSADASAFYQNSPRRYPNPLDFASNCYQY